MVGGAFVAAPTSQWRAFGRLQNNPKAASRISRKKVSVARTPEKQQIIQHEFQIKFQTKRQTSKLNSKIRNRN